MTLGISEQQLGTLFTFLFTFLPSGWFRLAMFSFSAATSGSVEAIDTFAGPSSKAVALNWRPLSGYLMLDIFGGMSS